MITIERVSKRFGKTAAVDDVSLEIPAGDSVALWGTNGAGKTTLIRCVLGLLRFRGRVRVGGFDARTRGKRARRLIAYVPQELGFYDDLGVAAAVRYFARLRAVDGVEVEKVLASVGLEGHGGKRIRELSGGMKQRLALGIALLGDPPVLVLDEVTASLDACGREAFISLLSRLAGSGKSLLFASHRVDEVTALARRVVLLDKGRVTGEVNPTDLGSRLGAQTVLHITLHDRVRGRAIDVLRARGFPARLNGVGVLVPVPAVQKVAPLRILAEERIDIEDFELLGAPTHEEHRP